MGTITLTVIATPIIPEVNVSPTSAIFYLNDPKNLAFTLGLDALTAAQNKTLTITVDGTTLAASNYTFTSPKLTLSSTYLKTLAIGTHTVQLWNGTAKAGTITLHVSNSGYIDSGSSGCNTGAVLPMALMLLAPLALFRKKD